MTYREAVEEMKKLAGNRPWALMHETASYHAVQIHGYIDFDAKNGHALPAATYQEAIENVGRMLGMGKSDPAPEDAPDVQALIREHNENVVDMTLKAMNINQEGGKDG